MREDTLCRFVAFLGQQNLKHRSIKCYLSGVRFAQIHLNLGDPFRNKAMPRLEYVLTGIKQVQAKSGAPPKPRLPITPELLEHLRAEWLRPPLQPDLIMLWAAACVGFFGFLRAGEFTVPTVQSYDPEVHLSLQDLALDSHTSPSVARIRIKQSKRDPLRQGVDIFLGTTNTSICPVQALIQYIAGRSPDPGPLFVVQAGSPLTRSFLVAHLQATLQKVGVAPLCIHGPQFSHWGSNDGCEMWFGRLPNPNSRALEECSLPSLYKNPAAGASVSVQSPCEKSLTSARTIN